MAKHNNKGFSLTEIMVAIAILTVLLTPILRQLAMTMQTNRKAKEQQYASENAEYVLQYVQTSSLDELASATPTDGIYCVSDKISDGDIAAGNEAKHNCSIYVMNSGVVDPIPVQVIEYSTYEYELNDVELGARGTVYSRRVVLDDISNRIKTMEYDSGVDADGDGNNDTYGYRVSYNNEVAADGYELTSEGSMVQYDAEGYISAIVCERYKGSSSADPNQLNMGNMHNFDYTQMALINGYTTDYDEQARNDFYAEAVEYLRQSTLEADKKILDGILNGTGTLNTSAYLSGMDKLTIISIEDDPENKKYKVSVEVVYENSVCSEANRIQKSYSVYGQEFPYDVCEKAPEVYFEYQPFATSITEGSYVQYTPEEYILINNNVKDAKIYLIKPKWDQVRTNAYKYKTYSNIPLTDDNVDAIGAYYQYNDSLMEDGKWKEEYRENFLRVNINIASANEVTDDNNFTVYTNLLLEKTSGATVTSYVSYMDKEGNMYDMGEDKAQFTLNSANEYSTSLFPVIDQKTGAKSKRTAHNVVGKDWLMSMADEETTGNRLYTATVTLTPDKENINTVKLTGAKGAN